MLGYSVSEATVAKYMPTTRKPPSQTWRTFLANHVPDIVAIDFFTVPTLTFGVLYGFVVLRHEQRQVVHFNVTRHPTALWTAQQIVDAFPFDEAPRFLLRDRDQIYGEYLRQRVTNMGIEEVVVSPPVTLANPYAERLIGALRRELLDRVIVLNEAHLRRLMTSYLAYYHTVRPHLALDRNAPIPRPIQGPSEGNVMVIPHVGGLHHGYRCVAYPRSSSWTSTWRGIGSAADAVRFLSPAQTGRPGDEACGIWFLALPGEMIRPPKNWMGLLAMTPMSRTQTPRTRLHSLQALDGGRLGCEQLAPIGMTRQHAFRSPGRVIRRLNAPGCAALLDALDGL